MLSSQGLLHAGIRISIFSHDRNNLRPCLAPVPRQQLVRSAEPVEQFRALVLG